MADDRTANLIRLKDESEIKNFLIQNGWQEKSDSFYEKKFKNFRLVIEKENDALSGWKFYIIGKYALNNNKVIQDEINKLREIFSGFWFRDDAFKHIVGHEIDSEQVQKEPYVSEEFKKNKDVIQYLIATLLSSGADFIYNHDYFISFYVDKVKKDLRLKVIKIADSVELHFDQNGAIYLPDGERFL